MAEQEKTAAEEGQEAPAKGGLVSKLIWPVLAIAALGGGFATPMLINPSSSDTEAEVVDDGAPPAIIEFGEVTSTLLTERYNRYLLLNIKLQVAGSRKAEFEKLLETRKPELKSWLLAHCSDKSPEDLAGRTGQNLMRREIQANFNAILDPDGQPWIEAVLFEAFNIQ